MEINCKLFSLIVLKTNSYSAPLWQAWSFLCKGPFYILGNSVLDGVTLHCEIPAGAFDAGIFQTRRRAYQLK